MPGTIWIRDKPTGLNGNNNRINCSKKGAWRESPSRHTPNSQAVNPVVSPFNPVAVSRIQLYQLSTVSIASVVAIQSRSRKQVHAAKSAVHCGHFVAAFGMLDVQRGHGLLLSVTGAGFADILLTIRTMTNTASATIRKAMIVLMNAP